MVSVRHGLSLIGVAHVALGGFPKLEKASGKDANFAEDGIIMTRDVDFQAKPVYSVSLIDVQKGDTLDIMGQVVISRCNENDVENKGDFNPCHSNAGKKNCFVGEDKYNPWLRGGISMNGNLVGEWSSYECTKERHHCTLNVSPIRMTVGSDEATGDLNIDLLVSADSNGAELACDVDLVRIDRKGHLTAVHNRGAGPEATSTELVPSKYDVQRECADPDQTGSGPCKLDELMRVKLENWGTGQTVSVQSTFDMQLTRDHETCSPSVALYYYFVQGDVQEEFGEKQNQNCEHYATDCIFGKFAAAKIPDRFGASQRSLLSPRTSTKDLYVSLQASAAKYPCVNVPDDKYVTKWGSTSVLVYNGQGQFPDGPAPGPSPPSPRALYSADFSQPIDLLHERQMLDANLNRVTGPQGHEWVIESTEDRSFAESGGCRPLGPSDASSCLHFVNNGGDATLWLNRRFGPDSRLRFGFAPKDTSTGLAVVFVSATPSDSSKSSIFSLELPSREGQYKTYTQGELTNYGISYWRANERPCETNSNGACVANLKRNPGAQLVDQGKDRVIDRQPASNGFFDIVVERDSAGFVSLFVDGKKSVRWTDPNPRNRDGYFGLRQMASTEEAWYSHFVVEAFQESEIV